MGRPKADADTMALAFVVDSFASQASVFLRQDNKAKIHGEIYGSAEPKVVKKQVARALSLDHSGAAWMQVGKRDRVIGQMQKDFPGLRPVLFYSPYEAAAWAVISHRRHRARTARSFPVTAALVASQNFSRH